MISKEQYLNATCWKTDGFQNFPNRLQNTIENTDTLSDDEDTVVVEQEVIPTRLGKNVRWNEPLATMASFSPPSFAHSQLANSDMVCYLFSSF